MDAQMLETHVTQRMAQFRALLADGTAPPPRASDDVNALECLSAQFELAAMGDPRWRFVEQVVLEGGPTIDALAIGPGGVFALSLANHPRGSVWVSGDLFTVSGKGQPYMRDSRRQADRAARLLSAATGFRVDVSGMVVTINASDIRIEEQADGVQIVPSIQLAKRLVRSTEVLDEQAIERIHEAASRSATWEL